MEIIKPSFVIERMSLSATILTDLERFGRVCYKSESKISETMSIAFSTAFVAKLIRLKHESVLEHHSITVRFICDRGVSHELVRHRLASFSQESTRYVNYKERGIQFIEPMFWEKGSEEYECWLRAMEEAEKAYIRLIELGATPQEARSVLPHSVKTEIIVTANIREWRHILKVRTSKAAHPQMRELMVPLLLELQLRVPILFDDISIQGE